MTDRHQAGAARKPRTRGPKTGFLTVCLAGLAMAITEAGAAVVTPLPLARANAARPLLVASETRSNSDEQRAILEQKLRLLAAYLQSPAIRRIAKENNQAANELLHSAETLRESARVRLANGDLEASGAALDRALQQVSAAKRLVRGVGARSDSERSKAQFARMTREIESYLRSLRQALGEDPGDNGIAASLEQVENRVAEAKRIAEDGRNMAAVERLSEAYQAALLLVVRLRGGQTVAYRLSFATSEEELEYERRRNASYQTLVELVLQEGQPVPSGLRSVIERHLEESRALRLQADQAAATGNHAAAITTLEDSTGRLVRALQASGLPVTE